MATLAALQLVIDEEELICLWLLKRQRRRKRTWSVRHADRCGDGKYGRIVRELDLEVAGAGLNKRVQKTPLNFCTQVATTVDPPISTPDTLPPSPYSLSPSGASSASAEMTSSGSSSPLRRDSPSPLTPPTTAVIQSIPSTHPGLLSPLPTHVSHPNPSTSPCTLALKKRRTTDCVAHLDQERQKLTQQDDVDSLFVDVIKNMLANVNPMHRPDVKFKAYQLLFEAVRDFPRESS